MTEASARRIKKSQSFGVWLRYVPDTLSTRYRRASNVQRAFHTSLGHATEATLEHTWNVHWRASNARQTHSERIKRACSARGTYSGRISHTPETRRAFRKFLSMFKNFLSPNARERLLATYSDARRTYTKHT